ncbi:MAG: endolytic transglycosylase MltG [Deltaproteobacteria bacterium]|nr:endolytic transglycosylase MltG [Deltaproteobacteria bacterium]
MRRAATLLALLLVLALIAAGSLYAYVDFSAMKPVDPTSTEKLEVEVPKGASHAQIGRMLADKGLVPSFFVWRAYTRLHPGFDPKAGRHLLARSMSLIAMQKALSEAPLPEDVPVTIVEGWRLRDTDEALANDGWIKPGEYLAAAALDTLRARLGPEGADLTSLEGYLLPETYKVNRLKPLDAKKLVERQLEAFVERFQKANAPEIEKSGRTLNELVIMASMLEREEPNASVRPRVAGLLFKRLDAKWQLGVDATSRYSLADWNDRKAFLEKLRDPDDPYNTRLRKGLPKGPIGGPSLTSLLAALRPEPVDAWYYLHDANKTIHFAKTAEEHEANRRKFDVW